MRDHGVTLFLRYVYLAFIIFPHLSVTNKSSLEIHRLYLYVNDCQVQRVLLLSVRVGCILLHEFVIIK